MKPFLFCIAAGVMLVGLVPAASAQLLDPASLAQADTNGDGLLTEAEFLKHRSSYFAVMDKDASGGASEAEFNESFSARSKRMAARAFRELPGQRDMELIREAAGALGLENPFFRPHEGIAGATSVIGNREVINYGSYNYLGLNGDARVMRAAQPVRAMSGWARGPPVVWIMPIRRAPAIASSIMLR